MGTENQTSCHECGELQSLPQRLGATQAAVCHRCGALLQKGWKASQHYTLAFAVCALALLIPANMLPFMTLNYFGRTTTATIWQTVTSLGEQGSWFIAIVIALASIFFPVMKVIVMIALCLWKRLGFSSRSGAILYRMTKAVGRWSMLDIFVLGIVITLLKFGEIASAEVQPGALAFIGVVIFTMLAGESFDPKSLWMKNYDRSK